MTEETPIAEPRFVRASLAIFARIPYHGKPDNIWDEIMNIYEDADSLQGFNREHLHIAQTIPLRYMELSKARLADLAARILNLIAFIDDASSYKGPLIPPSNGGKNDRSLPT